MAKKYSDSDKGLIEEYIESLSDKNDYTSGDIILLSLIDDRDISNKYKSFETKEDLLRIAKTLSVEERTGVREQYKEARREFWNEVKSMCENYIKEQNIYDNKSHVAMEPESQYSTGKFDKSINKNDDMSAKKTNAPDSEQEEIQKKEKRPPQMVTVNGDKISHAHAFKAKNSEDWFWTAKINDIPLKAQLMKKEDVDGWLNKEKKVEEIMEKYYPTKLLPKVSPDSYKLPQSIQTAEGERQIQKFNVYKDNNVGSEDYGKWKFYAQVGDKKMSVAASKEDMNAYFDQTATMKQIISKNFGDRLGLKEYYQQFKLPENVRLPAQDIRLEKNAQNRFEISANLPQYGSTRTYEVSYADRQAIFQHKVATKIDLAAKYLSNDILNLTKNERQIENKMESGIKR